MNQRPIPVAEMIPPILDLLDQAGYSKHTLWGDMYLTFQFIVRFYRKHGKSCYDPVLTKSYISTLYHQYQSKEISGAHYRQQKKAALRMDEYYRTGTLTWTFDKKESKYQLNEEYTRLMNAFLNSRDFHPNTRWDFAWAVRRYLSYFQKKRISSLDKVSMGDVRQFIVDTASTVSDGSMHNLLCYLRQFHEFLMESGEPAPDCLGLFSYHIPRKRPVRTCVSDNEIALIIKQIDTSTRKGKRDKAIIMLGADAGLRAIDIIHLKLTDLDWTRGEIRIVQRKTGESLRLPILSEMGDALKDYILAGRIETTYQEVFLRERPPFIPLQDASSIEDIFSSYQKAAGIERHAFDGKGFHGLRRRLARNMLVTGTPVTTIAQVLGHQNMENTKQYLSLDSRNLKECALGFDGIHLERSGLL